MADMTLQVPDEGEFKGKGSQMVVAAQELVITNTDEYDHASQFLVEVKGICNRLLERFDDPCRKAKAAWDAMTKMRREAVEPFQTAEAVIKQKMATYSAEIEAKRAKETARLAAEAQRKAEEERKKQIDEARKLKDKEAVRNLQNAPLEVQAVAPKTPEVPKTDRVSLRKVWKVQYVDVSKLPQRYLMPDLKAIEATVRGLGAKHGIPGVTVMEETVVSARG